MKTPIHPWRDVGLPVGVALGTFCLLNFCWNTPFPDIELMRVVPAQVGVYLVGGLVALSFLARSLRRGLLSADDLGWGTEGRSPRRWLLGLGMTAALVAILVATQDVQATPRVGDYLFWFLFLMPATMAELLVFVCLGFCLPRRWLRERGLRPVWAGLWPGLFVSVSFGLYHYTHEYRWHEFALQLIPVMGIGLACFVLTRSLHLMFLLHNSIAAVGFTQAQYHQLPTPAEMNPATYLNLPMLAVLVVTFAVPCWLLRVLARLWKPGAAD